MREAIQSAVDAGLFGYPPHTISDQLSTACAAWQRDEYGWEVLPERVRPLGDVLQGMTVRIWLSSTLRDHPNLTTASA
ncbi:MAG TPA: hypothetical protein VIW24_01730 [Aldersonia sp.]